MIGRNPAQLWDVDLMKIPCLKSKQQKGLNMSNLTCQVFSSQARNFFSQSPAHLHLSAGHGSFDNQGCIPDSVNGCKFVRDLYELAHDSTGEVNSWFVMCIGFQACLRHWTQVLCNH